jgi:hypothetical protein
LPTPRTCKSNQEKKATMPMHQDIISTVGLTSNCGIQHKQTREVVAVTAKTCISSRSTSTAPPEPHGSLTVVPLIADKRYYGEAPVKFRCGPQGGRVQDWRKRGPEAGLLGSQAGPGGLSERRETGDYPGTVRRSRLSQNAASFPRCVMARKASHRKQRRTRNSSASAMTPTGYATRLGITPGAPVRAGH